MCHSGISSDLEWPESFGVGASCELVHAGAWGVNCVVVAAFRQHGYSARDADG